MSSIGPFPNTSANSAITNVLASASDTLILAANPRRRGIAICNFQGLGTATMYVSLGTSAASTASFTYVLAPNAQLTQPVPVDWTGMVRAIWDSASGVALVTEFTA